MKWLLLSFITLTALAAVLDKYPNFAALSENEKLDQDYRVITINRDSPITIFAIHGGLIEPGSDQMARELAEGKYNLYIFEGLKKENPFSLHITAAQFDEPQALEMARTSESCVSIHAYIGDGSKAICIGGNDKKLAQRMSDALKDSHLDFEVIYPCKAYPATHPKNIINRCAKKGVQLEISVGLWDEFSVDAELKQGLITTLKTSLTKQ